MAKRRLITADGGTYLRRTPAEVLQALRVRCCKTERADTLRAIIADAEQLGWTARNLRGEVEGFISRVRAKIEHLGPAARQRKHARVVDHSREIAPTTKMCSTAWERDALGNMSRVVWNSSADGPVPPTLPVLSW
jgi:hypothetical protein